MRTILLIICCICTACSANFPHPLHTAVPAINVGRPLGIRVVVRDARTVSPGVGVGRAATFVGEINQWRGESIPVYTASGQNLAADIGTAVCSAFTQQHWPCEAVESTFSGTVKDEMSFILQGPPVDRILYILVTEFYSDIGTTTTLSYDFDVTVWNGIGSFLAATGEHGKRVLETDSYFNPAKNAATVAPATLREILGSVLNAKPIRQSLRM